MDGVVHAPPTRLVDRVTGLVGPFEHAEAAAAAAKHLGHERQAVQRATLVERCENLAGAAHLDHLAGAQTIRSPEGHLPAPPPTFRASAAGNVVLSCRG